MLITEKKLEENQVTLDEAKVETQQRETELQTMADPAPARTIEARGGEIGKHSQKNRKVFRWALLLLVASLAIVGYLRRERLLRLSPAKTANQVEEGTAQTANNLPEGSIQISPIKQQLIGVQYGEAVYKPVFKTLRAVGRLTYDETKISHVHSKVEGWIEHVFVDFAGKQVRKGQPLISVYSPELWQTQQEYLLALKGRNELSASPFREAVTGSESLLQAARKRLELWDISEEQIEHIERMGKPIKALTIDSPSDGFVTMRNAYPKLRVTPETEIYTIADISRIWVIADIYEYEAPEIRLGQNAAVTLSYLPGRTFRGRVTYIYPQLDSATRTLKARIEIPNHGFALKLEMYANVELQINYGARVVVPEESVMDSGAEQIVFVAHEGGYFEPRKVAIGAKVGSEVIVLNGLKSGERVVTSANFLIDSESKLKSAAGGMGMPGMSHGGGHGGESKAPATKAPATGQPSPQPRQEDHSQHQPGATATPQPKPEVHSRHQPKSQE